VHINAWLRGRGIPDTAHALRHIFATEVQRATGGIQVTAGLFGHANLQNVAVYARSSAVNVPRPRSEPWTSCSDRPGNVRPI
jgi:integrase